jgi:hypothetical protein
MDLTVIFLTANEVPESWADYQKAVLLEAVDVFPIITVSRKPLSWGLNIVDTEPKTISNIYYQMLRACKVATTDYVAIAEDDTLYPYEHFHSFRPPLDTFAYNINRLGLFTWGKPTYFFKYRQSNSTLLAPRLLLIEALEERFKKYPNGTPKGLTGEVGRKNIERALGLSHYKSVEFQTEDVSILRIDHPFGIDELAKSKRKGMGICRSYDVPRWGKAEDIVKLFK